MPRPVGEAEAGDRGHDHVERVGGIAAVTLRVGQARDQVEHLDERARPAVHDQQRQRRRPAPARVDQVQAEAVDVRAEVRQRVDRALLRAPVEPGLPVAHELAHVAEARAVVPARALDLVRPARAREALAEVVEHGLRDVDGERSDVHWRPVRARPTGDRCRRCAALAEPRPRRR
jgi:hypothetical protein